MQRAFVAGARRNIRHRDRGEKGRDGKQPRPSTAPDVDSSMCLRCGQTGHCARDCTESDKTFLNSRSSVGRWSAKLRGLAETPRTQETSVGLLLVDTSTSGTNSWTVAVPYKQGGSIRKSLWGLETLRITFMCAALRSSSLESRTGGASGTRTASESS